MSEEKFWVLAPFLPICSSYTHTVEIERQQWEEKKQQRTEQRIAPNPSPALLFNVWATSNRLLPSLPWALSVYIVKWVTGWGELLGTIGFFKLGQGTLFRGPLATQVPRHDPSQTPRSLQRPLEPLTAMLWPFKWPFMRLELLLQVVIFSGIHCKTLFTCSNLIGRQGHVASRTKVKLCLSLFSHEPRVVPGTWTCLVHVGCLCMGC